MAEDLRPPWPEHRHHKRAGVWAGGDPMSNLVARGSPCVRPHICLPRLNKACPNPSKWRESLGIRGRCPTARQCSITPTPLRGLTVIVADQRPFDELMVVLRDLHMGEALPIPARIPPLPRAQRHGQRLPAGDGPGTGASLRGVGHAREPGAAAAANSRAAQRRHGLRQLLTRRQRTSRDVSGVRTRA